jgi:hypothetical protein
MTGSPYRTPGDVVDNKPPELSYEDHERSDILKKVIDLVCLKPELFEPVYDTDMGNVSFRIWDDEKGTSLVWVGANGYISVKTDIKLDYNNSLHRQLCKYHKTDAKLKQQRAFHMAKEDLDNLLKG